LHWLTLLGVVTNKELHKRNHYSLIEFVGHKINEGLSTNTSEELQTMIVKVIVTPYR